MYELCDELQSAVIRGSVERTVALLAGGDIDIDERRPKGWTALMLGASTGDVGVVRILVNKGANLSLVDDRGFSALHLATQGGHVAVTKLLMEAGADPEAQVSATDPTPLYAAAEQGHSEVVGVLIEAGADPNTRGSGGLTPLYIAAGTGRVTAIKVLLRAKANPLLGCDDDTTPLDVAAQNGHLEVVDTLIQECGIEGCGGASGGVAALKWAADKQHLPGGDGCAPVFHGQ